MKNTLTSLLLLLLSGPVFAQDTLRLLTWNVQMLPNVTKGNSRATRARAIVEQLKQRNDDVVVFQEVFHRRARKIIQKGLRHSFHYQTPVLNRRLISLKTNGGVMIVSKHEIVERKEIRYKSRSGFDRLSRKGAMLVLVDFHGKEVQIAGTHLQAFGTQRIMEDQYRQFHDALLKPNQKADVPQFVCGDFNTLKTLPPQLPEGVSQSFADRLARYAVMLKTLDAVDGDLTGDQQFTMDRPYNDLCVTRKEFRLLLDYILVRPNRLEPYVIRRKVQTIRQKWSDLHQDLSDHFAVEAIIKMF